MNFFFLGAQVLSNFFLRCLVSKGLWATYKKNKLFPFLLERRLQFNWMLIFSLPARGQRPWTPHWIRWFSNIQANQPAKSSIQAFSTQIYLFWSTSVDPTPDPLPLVIVSTLFYMYSSPLDVLSNLTLKDWIFSTKCQIHQLDSVDHVIFCINNSLPT